jgi:Uncharacterized protein conserved in bacteria (DUF2325)
VKSRKRIWELQHQTICKVLGMCLQPKELKKIATKFGISNNDPLLDDQFVLHSSLVHLCQARCEASLHTDKVIENKFAKFAAKLTKSSRDEILASITESPQQPKIPLWALLWELTTRRLGDAKAVESALFGHIHMLEHRLLKEYWHRSCDPANSAEEMKAKSDEIVDLKRQILDLKQENKKLRTSENGPAGTLVVSAMTETTGRALPARKRTDQTANRSELVARTQRFRNLLQSTRERIRFLEKERAELTADIRLLTEDLVDREEERRHLEENQTCCPCPIREALQGKKVTMVGGIESLEPHYKDMVEAMGGSFVRHDGVCRRGDGPLEACILSADLVVCPVEVNSHNAAKSVKKICKNRNIRCCFPRTAGLTGLRRAIEEHCTECEVA